MITLLLFQQRSNDPIAVVKDKPTFSHWNHQRKPVDLQSADLTQDSRTGYA